PAAPSGTATTTGTAPRSTSAPRMSAHRRATNSPPKARPANPNPILTHRNAAPAAGLGGAEPTSAGIVARRPSGSVPGPVRAEQPVHVGGPPRPRIQDRQRGPQLGRHPVGVEPVQRPCQRGDVVRLAEDP